MKRSFSDLDEHELLALAIALEEEDGRVYGAFADRFRESHPHTAEAFAEMREEEAGHRDRLLARYRERFGDQLPFIRRQDVKGFIERRPIWLNDLLPVERVRSEAESMEIETRRFYQHAAARTQDVATRELLDTLADEEAGHAQRASRLERDLVASGAAANEDVAERRRFVLQIIQPGLVGLMDGSVSTLAPVFAAAFATRDSWDAFIVGMAASIGAGISMGFAEALSDDGALSGRGRPYLRGAVCGAMTTLGGIGHTLPFLVKDFRLAMGIAFCVVLVELGVISWIRHRYMETPLVQTIVQVVLGGALVFLAGVLIGNA
ncbi:MAG: ferritin family protein [Terrimicrobiaceae bacterium]|nr:ferritin family protein [Terrimicrobiaceae bacterium]